MKKVTGYRTFPISLPKQNNNLIYINTYSFKLLL